MKTLKAYKYRLYPSKAQRRVLDETLETCRRVYNNTLAYRKEVYETEARSAGYYETAKLLPKWKETNPYLSNVHSQVLQDVQRRVDKAYNNFFRRVKQGTEKPGFPRFKGQGRYDSFTYPQSGFSILDNKRLRVSKVGDLKIKLHRPTEGIIKTLTLRRDACGNWWASFSCEVEIESQSPTGAIIGIDLGLSSIITTSEGTKVDPPRFFRMGEKKLAKAQRKLDKLEKGTEERAHHKLVVAKVHRKIANQRADFNHKLARQLVTDYDVICYEDLSVSRMVHNHCLAKSIMDAAWTQLVDFTQYKAVEAGKVVVTVNPYNTTKRCSRCGTLVNKDLSVRIHECPNCGLVIDRDVNAAINILSLGLQALGVSP
jgi:putative transposase